VHFLCVSGSRLRSLFDFFSARRSHSSSSSSSRRLRRRLHQSAKPAREQTNDPFYQSSSLSLSLSLSLPTTAAAAATASSMGKLSPIEQMSPLLSFSAMMGRKGSGRWRDRCCSVKPCRNNRFIPTPSGQSHRIVNAQGCTMCTISFLLPLSVGKQVNHSNLCSSLTACLGVCLPLALPLPLAASAAVRSITVY
jgi:hypothetical protein